MARKSRARPKAKSPEEIMRARRLVDFAAVGLAPDSSVLSQNATVVVVRAGEERQTRRVQNDTARRMDAFEALREGMAKGAYDAARRLERDITLRHGDQDRGRSLDRVDQGSSQKDRVDVAIDAGRRVDAVLARMGQRDAWLLSELIRPTPERYSPIIPDERKDAETRREAGVLAARWAREAKLPEEKVHQAVRTAKAEATTIQHMTWRAIVFHVTGEENPVAQAARVRGACDNLAAAYADLDGRRAA